MVFGYIPHNIMATLIVGILISASDYYVSTTGSDSDDGLSSSTPWQTIAKINSSSFNAGDIIHLKGGETFSGSLIITDSGTNSNPIVVTSYGTGRAIIDCGDDRGIQVLDSQYVTVDNIEVVGSGVSTVDGSTTSISPGIVATSTQLSGARWQGITIKNNLVHGCWLGILVEAKEDLTGQATYRGYTNVLIEDNEVYECGHTGILFWAQQNRFAGPFNGYYYSTVLDVHTDITIRGNNVYDMYGTSEAGLTDADYIGYGTGIRTMSVTGGVVEYNRVYNVGHCGHNSTGTPAGFEAEVSEDITWQYNEAAYCIVNTGANDGAGMDVLDGFTHNMIVQYNYCYNNGGYGIGGGAVDATPLDGHIIRFNVLVNNGTGNGTGGTSEGEVSIWGAMTNLKFYNNIVWSNQNGSYLFNIPATCTGYIVNNIFVSLGTRDIFNTTTATNPLLLNNLYWRGSAGGLEVTINGVTYNTLAALRAAGQETLSAVNYGINADPLLVNEGVTPSKLMAALVSTLTDYDLDTGSPALDTAVSFPTQLGSYPLVDFHGTSFSLTLFNIGPQQ